jgi:peptide/nickel transport system permease protein
MSIAASSIGSPASRLPASPGLWTLAWRRLVADRVGLVSLWIVGAFVLLVVLSGTGLVAADWSREIARSYAPPTFVGTEPVPVPGGPGTPGVAGGAGVDGAAEPAYVFTVPDPIGVVLEELRRELGRPPGGGATGPAATGPGIVDPLADVLADIRREMAGAAAAPGPPGGDAARAAGRAARESSKGVAPAAVPLAERRETLPFGADKWGRDVVKKVIKGSETSIFVGLAAALVATFLGTVFGALAGFYGRAVDDVFNWFYSVFTSIPYLLLILAIAAVLQQKGMLTIILILGLTGWTGIFRLVRAEYIRHKSREYVQAADAIGASAARRMFVHVFPNVSHVVLVQLSLHVVGFIKAEVILSFLGFGVPVDVVSWGSMLNEAQNELILGKWWQLVAAGTAMAVLVTAFSLLTDALRDALDPRLKGTLA